MWRHAQNHCVRIRSANLSCKRLGIWLIWRSMTHLICSVLRWRLRAWARMSSENGGLSFLRWRSKWAVLEKAWTPASVLLDTDRDTGLSGFSLWIASCRKTQRDIKSSGLICCTKKKPILLTTGNLPQIELKTATWGDKTVFDYSFLYAICVSFCVCSHFLVKFWLSLGFY